MLAYQQEWCKNLISIKGDDNNNYDDYNNRLRPYIVVNELCRRRRRRRRIWLLPVQLRNHNT